MKPVKGFPAPVQPQQLRNAKFVDAAAGALPDGRDHHYALQYVLYITSVTLNIERTTKQLSGTLTGPTFLQTKETRYCPLPPKERENCHLRTRIHSQDCIGFQNHSC